MKIFVKEFDSFLYKLKIGENFAFTRFSDGEIFILSNKMVILGENFYVTGNIGGSNIYTEEEQKEFIPGRDEFLRLELKASFDHRQKNYYKGIPSKQDMVHLSKTLEEFEIVDQDDYTFSNVFINGNYKRFIEEIVTKIFPTRDIVYVVNKNADLSGLPFGVYKDYRIGSNCMKNDYDIINEMKKDFQCGEIKKGSIILCSAASLSNLIIHKLFKEFPEYTFLDIGSTLNPYLGKNMQGWVHTRDYLRTYWLGHKTHYGEQKDEWLFQ